MVATEDITSCVKCKHLGHSEPKGPFIQIGEGRILIIAESPAKNGWRASGIAFYTPEGKILATGKRLNEELAPFNLAIEKCSFTELAKCYLNDRKLLKQSGLNCMGHLKKQINILKPDLIITLGVITKEVFEIFFEKEFPIGKLSKVDNFNYLPLFHPSPASPYGHERNLEILNRQVKEIEKIIK